jgi:hypothetical protein
MIPKKTPKDLTAQLTCTRQDDFVRIDIIDKSSRNMMLHIKMTTDDFYKAFCQTRSDIYCQAKLFDTSDAGKSHHHKQLTVEILDSNWDNRKEIAIKAIELECKKWSESTGVERYPDLNFNSQNSFTSRDGADFATTTVRWYLDENS